MGTITGHQIADSAAALINDKSHTRWTEPDLLDWINQGQGAIVTIKPDACTQTGNITLVAGAMQSLPANGLRLIDVHCNMGTDGATPGAVITLIGRDQLDSLRPNWRAESNAASVRHVIYDNRTPKAFLTYPPAQAGLRIEGSWSAVPAPLTNLATTISIDDIYSAALVQIVIAHAMSRQSIDGNMARAAFHLNAASALLGAKARIDVAWNPNKNAPPVTPSAEAGER